MKGWWKAYASMLLARVNTATGIRYRDEPAILAWELGNEFRCSSCAGTHKLHDAIGELASYLKSLGPTQLISDGGDRKSTRLNSSHTVISYAVFCLKKKKKIQLTY